MHYAKKYLLSPINLAPGNFSGCPVVFVWCDAVNNHYLITFSTPFIVCSLPHLPFSRLKSSHLFIIPLQKLSLLPSSLFFNFYPLWDERTRLHAKVCPAWTDIHLFLLKQNMKVDYSLVLICFWRGLIQSKVLSHKVGEVIVLSLIHISVLVMALVHERKEIGNLTAFEKGTDPVIQCLSYRPIWTMFLLFKLLCFSFFFFFLPPFFFFLHLLRAILKLLE